MKKYVFLTSILALAACGGGGGGHHDNGGRLPDVPALPMPADVQSFGAGGASTAVAKSGGTGGDRFIFTLDGNGVIKSVVEDNREYVRNGDKNEYIYTDDYQTRTMNLVTLGREAGLQYADFGYAQELENKSGYLDRDIDVFAGGYADKEYVGAINPATYKGVAVAYIEADNPDGTVYNQVSKTDDASLVIEAGQVPKLTMNFSKAENPWYDVVFENGWKITLSDADNKVDDKFKVTNSMVRGDMYSSHDYYGPNAEEAVYQLGAEYKDNTTGREVDFDAVFGGKKE